LDDPSPQASFCKKCGGVKCSVSWFSHLNGPFPKMVVFGRQFRRVRDRSDLK
jgi:hypothetical protein